MNDEKYVEKKLCKAVRNVGGLALKLVSPGFDGIPDRLILIAYGRMAFVEVKAPGEKPRPLQVARINKLRNMGFKVFVLNDVKNIPAIIDSIKGGD